MTAFHWIFLNAMVYAGSAVFLFGGVLRPIAFLTFWSDRLGVSNWAIFVVAGYSFALLISLLCVRLGLWLHLLPAVFISTAMVSTTVSLGAYTEFMRSEEIERFDPDIEMRNSFFASLRYAPREFQFFLHGAALKECVPYAWSYRTMSFYELPQNTAVNVLPQEWVAKCEIERSR